MTKEQLAALAVLEHLETKRAGDIREVVGYIDCRCGLVAKVVRGKVKVYESCSSCGTKLANGHANTKYILSNMRFTPEKPESSPETVPEKQHEAEALPVPEKPEKTPEKKIPESSKPAPSLLVRVAKAFLAFELFEL